MKPGLENGILRVKNSTGKGVEKAYIIANLGESDLPEIMALQDVIVRHLQCSSLLEPFSSEFMREHLGRRGFVLGVFTDGDLVGFRNVYFPAAHDTEWNLGQDVGLSEDLLHQVANLQMICVHPDYRGNGLALSMNRIALDLLRRRGSHGHICATVSPLNIWNLPILIASGFHIRNLKLKYGGKLRYIVYQRLKVPVEFHPVPMVKVSLKELDTQKQLLDAGYCAIDLVSVNPIGVQTVSEINQWELVFRRPIDEPRVHVVPRRSAASGAPGKSRHGVVLREGGDATPTDNISDGNDQK